MHLLAHEQIYIKSTILKQAAMTRCISQKPHTYELNKSHYPTNRSLKIRY